MFPYSEKKIWNLLEGKARKHPGPQGFCQIYLDGQLVEQRSNLVVAFGREWVAQKLFGETTVNGDFRDYEIGLFAVGAGGATVNANVVQLQGPTICDTGLYRAISLGNTSYLNDPNTYDETDLLLDPYDIYKSVDAVKPIRYDPEGDITLVEVDYSGVCQYFTKVKCTCVVPPGEPQNLPVDGEVPISEAGLYFAKKLQGSPELWDDASGAEMFAHICFSPKWKEKSSEFRIIWYIVV
jgi:hypothetical protein